MQTGVFLGLSAALLWGVADFCARGASRAAGTFRTLLFVEVIAIPALLLLTGPFELIVLRAEQWPLILAAALVGLIILGGAGLLYRAFAIGKLALVSPIASAFAAVTALLAIATGERLAGLTLLGVIVTLVGVTLASTSGEGAHAGENKAAEQGKHRLAPGLPEAIGAMLTFGVGYWLLDFIVPTLGGVTTAFIAKVGDLIALGAIALFLTWRAPRKPQPELRISQTFWLWVIPVALLDTAANIAYNIGIATALTSVVVTLSSLFSAVTVLLAWVILRERLALWQWVGVLTILLGVLLVNLRA
ncbi:MAG TPA: DMT family transporter [Ktedonobacterales bacterium]|jgi:drug/metabolite transporter (DMT)-like permease|nr:DMT family transporter [Ktedonobacterales bacterium]